MKKIIPAGFLAAVAVLLSTAIGSGQAPGALATLSGSVTADSGSVRAVRVKATDTVRRIAYTVFTKNGQYRLFNLPPGTYQVAALQAGFDSTSETVDLTAGAAKQVNVALTTKQEKSVKVVDFDELYPPGPARDLLMKECAGCHSFAHIPWHKMGPRSEDAWHASVMKMFNITPPNPVPRVAPGVVSEEGKALITKYFNDNFGQDSVPREFKRDPLPLDEEALSQAIYVQYELPPPGRNAAGQTIAARRMHDVYPSQVSQNVWIVDTQTGAILGMDRQNPDYQTRFREWLLPSPTRFSVFPHGIVESQGRVYFTELQNSALGSLDPNTGEISEYPTPEKGLPHTPRMDSKGNIWFSKLYNNSRVDMLDVKTRKVLEWDPAPDLKNANYYGLTVDRQDRVWAVAMTAASIVGYDPKTDKWTRYPTPTPMSGPRRPTVAPDGRVWFSENTGDAIGVLDPKTGKITEYKSPVRHGGEYECFSDAQGHIWVSLRAYDTLARFDPKDAKFTYYPYPNLTGFVPKIETDPQGTIWFGIGTTLASFRANGNVPARQTAAR